MKNIITKKRNTSRIRIVAALAFALSASTAIADENRPKFTMTVFEDSPQGANIILGHYDKAINAVSARKAKNDAIIIESNLCVAYVKTGDVERASQSCNAAVAAIRNRKHFGRFAFSFESGADARRRYLAVALSNRSVVNAVKGDYEAARKDLDAALELRTRLAAVRINLERLDIAEQNAA